MSHWMWLRFGFLATTFKTVTLPKLSHNFPWAVHSWPATYSWIPHQNWLLTKTAHARLKSTSVQSWWAIFVVVPWRQADQVYPAENGSLGCCRAESQGGAHRIPPASPGRALKDTLQHSWTHLFVWPGWIWPKVMNSKNVSFCLLLFWEFTFWEFTMLCMLLVSVAMWLFLLQTTVSQPEFFLFFIIALHCCIG